jgi:hypothetical protein
LSAKHEFITRLMKTAAVVCLVAVLATASVQAIHIHAGSTRLDSHCSLCMVSHCVLRPQSSFVISIPARVVHLSLASFTSSVLRSGIFYWFVRPPPSA